MLINRLQRGLIIEPFRNSIQGGAVASGTTYPDVTFWLNFEANDTSGDYNMGATECSSGGTAGAYTSDATINSTSPILGSYDLSILGAYDRMSFTTDLDKIFSNSIGRIGFYYKNVTWIGYAYIIRLGNSTNNDHLLVRTSSSAGRMYIAWYYNNNLTTPEAALTTSASYLINDGNPHFVEVYYNTDTDTLGCLIDGNDAGSASASMTASRGWNLFYIGNETATAPSYKIDNVMVSKDNATRNFYADGLYNLTSKPAGACP